MISVAPAPVGVSEGIALPIYLSDRNRSASLHNRHTRPPKPPRATAENRAPRRPGLELYSGLYACESAALRPNHQVWASLDPSELTLAAPRPPPSRPVRHRSLRARDSRLVQAAGAS